MSVFLVVLFGMFVGASSTPVAAETVDKAPERHAELVVILHGIARTGQSMKAIQKALQDAGYETFNITYPSTRKNLDALADDLHEAHLKQLWQTYDGKIHIVTHSMGGLLARRYLTRYGKEIPEGRLGRIVMLAPPNGGSEIADLLHGFAPYRRYYGPAGQELTTSAAQERLAAETKALETLHAELGIIAGTKEWPYIAAAFIVPGKGDGRVSVEKTKMPSMKDHITVSATHTFIMDRPDVHRHIIRFLQEGKFHHEP
ncbi:MAG: alpha/beta fold hydrolase [Alphaproteobacteria bacterium]|nr:alpha/beta fold hydrolase [Alphaproteobacteria bacterium]